MAIPFGRRRHHYHHGAFHVAGDESNQQRIVRLGGIGKIRGCISWTEASDSTGAAYAVGLAAHCTLAISPCRFSFRLSGAVGECRAIDGEKRSEYMLDYTECSG